MDPSDHFVYVANDNSNNVSAYAIDSDTGALTPVTGSPFAAGQGSASVAIDPPGKFVYVGNEDDSPGGDISGYKIDAATGALTPLNGSPFLPESGGFGVTVAPSGRFGYVGSGGDQVTAFSIKPHHRRPYRCSRFALPGIFFSDISGNSIEQICLRGGRREYLRFQRQPHYRQAYFGQRFAFSGRRRRLLRDSGSLGNPPLRDEYLWFQRGLDLQDRRQRCFDGSEQGACAAICRSRGVAYRKRRGHLYS